MALRQTTVAARTMWSRRKPSSRTYSACKTASAVNSSLSLALTCADDKLNKRYANECVALLDRISTVKTERDKLKKDNETLQTYIDNLTRNKFAPLSFILASSQRLSHFPVLLVPWQPRTRNDLLARLSNVHQPDRPSSNSQSALHMRQTEASVATRRSSSCGCQKQQ